MKRQLNNILDILRRLLGVRSPILTQQGYYRCDNCRYYNDELYECCTKFNAWTTPRLVCKKFKPRRTNK